MLQLTQFDKARLNKAESTAKLVQKILPQLSNEELSNLLLGAVSTKQAVVQLDPEALAGLVGEAEAQVFQEAAEPLPAQVIAINAEFQATAAALKATPASKAKTASTAYWQGQSAPAAWTREVSFLEAILWQYRCN